MFKHKPRTSAFHADFSGSYRTPTAFKATRLAIDELGLSGDITALAVDPVGGYWAVGLSTGSIHIVGARPVQVHLSVLLHPPTPRSSSSSSAIKHLAFHPSRGRLVAIDARSQAHVWSLRTIDPITGLPWKEATNSLYGTVTSMDVPSPSTSHLPVTMKDGTTAFLDLERNAFLAPYRVPNVWAQQEDRLKRSGMPVPARARPAMAVAVQVSPRDLDQVLVAYEGGVILWSISKQVAIHSYALMLPPGAPGGGSYQDDDLFTERNPGVTCITWHPSALCFAVGYEDGCIAFWAVEDPDKPLSVRTVETNDVNVTDAESLFDSGALDRNPDGPPNQGGPSPRREPIFKLSWASFPDATALTALEAAGQVVSDETKAFAGRDETCLLVLGGLLPSHQPGLNVLQFPAYRPPSVSVAPSSGSYGISSAVRAAFRDSLTATGTFLYSSLPGAQVEDFLLVPRSSPFLGGGLDAIALLIVESGSSVLPPVAGTLSNRELRALTFPPVRSTVGRDGERKEYGTGDDAFVPMTAPPQMVSASPTPASSSGWGLSSPGLGSTPASEVPRSLPPIVGSEGFGEYRLPATFWAGSHTLLGCHLVDVPRESFAKLRRWDAGCGDGWDGMPRLPLEGGRANPTTTGAHPPNMRMIKLEKNRLLVSWHRDGTARFFDLSPQLLAVTDPIPTEYPLPLPALSILLQPLLAHPSLARLPISRLLRSDPTRFLIQDVQFASEACEVAVVLATGEVVYFRWSEAREDMEVQARIGGLSLGGDQPADVVDLTSLSDWTVDGFKPVCLVDVGRGPVAACAVCDAGFLAISYLQDSICIIDLRGPEVVLREGFGNDSSRSERRGSVGAVASSLKFAVCGLGSDPNPQVRLVASYESGLTRVTTLSDGLAGWTIDKKTASVTHDSQVRPVASFVLDAIRGDEQAVNLHRLKTIGQAGVSTGSQEVHSVWVAVAARSIRTQANVIGDRLAKVDLTDDIRAAELICREGQTVLIVTFVTGRGEVYSLPGLELVFQAQLTPPGGSYSFSSSSSDYVHVLGPVSVSLGSVLHVDGIHPLAPTFDLENTAPGKALGAQPLPVQSSVLASWLGSWGGGVLTGNQIDTLIAGPKRPAPASRPAQGSLWGGAPETDVANRVQSDVAKAAMAKSSAQRSARGSTSASSSAAREEIQSGKSVYEQMTDAAALRGNMLDGLSDRLNDVGRQAGEWQKQAQRLAMQESAKSTAKSFFGKLL